MDNKCPEIINLCSLIEQSVERKMRTPTDFGFLSGVVWERLHEYISPTTLKRTWGYITGSKTIRYSTLSVLARFAGYRSWEEYVFKLAHLLDVESDFASQANIDTSLLKEGDRVEVAWNPNRHCVFTYTGNGNFTVTEAVNTHLRCGDSCTIAWFIEGEPLYLSNLRRNNGEGKIYLCGNKNGLTMVKLIGR